MYPGLACMLGVSARKCLFRRVLEPVVPLFLLCLKAVLTEYILVSTVSKSAIVYEKNWCIIKICTWRKQLNHSNF